MALPPAPKQAFQPYDLSQLGRGFDVFLENHGRWLIYAKVDRRYPCGCYDADSQTSASDVSNECPKCFGTGFLTILSREKGHIAFDVKKTYGTSSGVSPAYMGETDSTSGVLYLRAGILPNYLDLAYEVEWDVPYTLVGQRGLPVRYINGWKIKKPTPVIMGGEGSPDLWLCGLEQHSQKRDYMEAALRSAGQRISPPGNNQGLSPRQSRPFGGHTGNRYLLRDQPNRGNRVPHLPLQ